MFTSPHLCRFTERIRVAGSEIPKRDVARLFRKVSDLPFTLTFFERAALMAFCHFAEQEVDVAVVEVGLGGRLDVTNLIRPEVSVICQVAHDHTAYLGTQLSRIAWEKAGILKPGVPAVLAPGETDEVRGVIERMAEVRGTPVFWHPEDLNLEPAPPDGPFVYQGPGGPLSLPGLALPGAHQLKNAACALAAVSLLQQKMPSLDVTDEAKTKGLKVVRWPGRMEFIDGVAQARILLDAAHNPAGAEALARTLETLEYDRLVMVTGVMEDKDAAATMDKLLPFADEVIFTRVAYYRGKSPKEMRKRLAPADKPSTAVPDVAGALDLAAGNAREGDLILVTGSVFLMGEARAHLLGEPVDPFQVTDPVSPDPKAAAPSNVK
jgi:dihydrofolate synthase/folylpolyglutamate synthase